MISTQLAQPLGLGPGLTKVMGFGAGSSNLTKVMGFGAASSNLTKVMGFGAGSSNLTKVMGFGGIGFTAPSRLWLGADASLAHPPFASQWSRFLSSTIGRREVALAQRLAIGFSSPLENALRHFLQRSISAIASERLRLTTWLHLLSSTARDLFVDVTERIGCAWQKLDRAGQLFSSAPSQLLGPVPSREEHAPSSVVRADPAKAHAPPAPALTA